MKLISLILIITMLVPGAVGCKKESPAVDLQDIVILFTGDSYGSISDNIGYDGLTAYKYETKSRTDNVTLVDLGNTLVGDTFDTSLAEKVAEAMGRADYDFCIPGYKEFDIGLDEFSDIVFRSEAQYLGFNVNYTGSEENKFSYFKPYSIVNYGALDVAFIGVIPPDIASVNSAEFTEDGEVAYSFKDSKTAIYNGVQEQIKACKSLGAEYIVVLSHLGTDNPIITSTELAKNTSGIDVILDGDSSSKIKDPVEDKEKDSVIIATPDKNLGSIGELVIKTDGSISVSYVKDYDKKDSAVNSFIQNEEKQESVDLEETVGNSAYTLTAAGEEGSVKNREQPLGNLCADAYRYVMQTDMAFVAGGEIAADLETGELTVSSLKNILANGDPVCVVEMTGEDIMSVLDMSCKDLDMNSFTNGEFDGFLQISGVKYSVIGYYVTGVALDENGMYAGLNPGDSYRIENVTVLGNDGNYYPIDPSASYTVAVSADIVKNSAYGYSMFKDKNITATSSGPDYQILGSYIENNLGGEVHEKYTKTDDRIHIKRTING